MPRWQVVLAAAVAIGSGAILGGPVPESADPEKDIVLTTHRSPDHGYGDYGFSITASSVSGLYPGARKHIEVTFANPYNFPLKVYAVKAKTVSTTKRKCTTSSDNLTVGPYAGDLPMTIPPRGRKRAGKIPLRMPNSVSDHCQNVTFKIQINGTATKAGR